MFNITILKCLGRGGAFLGSPRAEKYIVAFAQANADGSLKQGRI